VGEGCKSRRRDSLNTQLRQHRRSSSGASAAASPPILVARVLERTCVFALVNRVFRGFVSGRGIGRYSTGVQLTFIDTNKGMSKSLFSVSPLIIRISVYIGRACSEAKSSHLSRLSCYGE